MYVNEKKNIYEIFMRLNERSTKCVLCIYSLPAGTRKYSVLYSVTRGKVVGKVLVESI